MSGSNSDLMSSCIATKISVPRSSAGQLTRKSLLSQLDEGRYQTLTYIRGPAGFGKSTLLVQWRNSLLESNAHVAWYGVDESDNEESQFISYLVSSLSKAGCSLGDGAFGMYRRGDDSAKNDFVRSLINDLATINEEVYLVLDDFHLIVNDHIWSLLSVILTLAPTNFHLVIASRQEAPFSVTELRMHGQLNEIVVSELAFSYDETSMFLNQNSPKVLTFDQVRLIYDMSEGWAAALQLIVLSIKRKNHPDQVIQSLQHLEGMTDIVEYLVKDWLSRLPDDICMFFLKNSIFERFNIELATAITGSVNAAEIIHSFETENFFLVPLEGEGEGQWYRYHHLLSRYLKKPFFECECEGDCQQAEHSFRNRMSQMVEACDLKELNKKASIWFSEHGLMVESVKHALAAGEMELAIKVLENCAMDMVGAGELNTLLAWLDQIPKKDLDHRPRLKFAKGWALVLSCQLVEASQVYDDLRATSYTDNSISEFEMDTLKGGIAVYSYDAEGALEILEHWPFKGDSWNVSVAANILAFGHISAGDIEAAVDVLHWAAQMDPHWDSFYPGVYRNGFLGLSMFLIGDFTRAEELYREALHRAEKKGGRRSPPALVIAGLLSSLYYEKNRLRELEMLMANRFDVVTASAYPGGVIPSYIYTSRIKYLSGDVAGARTVLAELHARGVQADIPAMSILALTERIRINLEEGEVEQAKNILERLYQDDSFTKCITDQNSPEVYYALQSFELKIALCLSEFDSVLQRVEGLYDWCRYKFSLSSKVEVLIIWSVALQKVNKCEAKLKMIEALELGATIGITRMFLDNLYLSSDLLAEVLEEKAYTMSEVDTNIGSLVKEKLGDSQFVKQQTVPIGKFTTLPDASVAEEYFSNKEIEVLQLIDQGMPNKLMARTLNVTINTIKWHVKNIYSKLGVSSRFEALAKARENGLLDS